MNRVYSNLIQFNNYEEVHYMGDIHGDFTTLSKCLNNYNNCVFVICGDIGVGFHDRNCTDLLLSSVSRLCVKNNIQLCLVRGNHDNPIYFNHNCIELQNITFICDYSIITTSKDNILCIGGAISIDRSIRIPSKSYWSCEEVKKPSYQESEFIERFLIDNDITVVVSHTSPISAYPSKYHNPPIVRHYTADDEFLSIELNEERTMLEKIVLDLLPDNKTFKWYYAHFHTSEQGIGNSFEHKCLDIFEIE